MRIQIYIHFWSQRDASKLLWTRLYTRLCIPLAISWRILKLTIHEATFVAGDMATLLFVHMRAAHEISNATFYTSCLRIDSPSISKWLVECSSMRYFMRSTHEQCCRVTSCLMYGQLKCQVWTNPVIQHMLLYGSNIQECEAASDNGQQEQSSFLQIQIWRLDKFCDSPSHAMLRFVWNLLICDNASCTVPFIDTNFKNNFLADFTGDKCHCKCTTMTLDHNSLDYEAKAPAHLSLECTLKPNGFLP